MELGEIIWGLKRTDPNLPVIIGRFDLVCLEFVELISYKQYYAELAIVTKRKLFTDDFKTVKEVLPVFEEAVNKEFPCLTGFPYTMMSDTDVWVANYNEYGSMVTGLYDLGDRVEIRF